MVAPAYGWIDSIIRGIAIPLAVMLAFRYFARRFPVGRRPADKTEAYSEPISGAWTILARFLCIAGGISLFLVIVYTVRFWNRFLSLRHGQAAFLLTPSPAWWYLYAGFAGLCVTWFIAGPVMRVIMGSDRFHRWMIRGNQRAGFDSARALHLLALVIMVPYTVLFLPSLVCHTRFSESEIGIQRYAEVYESRYAYSDVKQAAIVLGYRDRSGTFQNDPRIILHFTNGRRWSSRDNFRDPEEISSNLTAFLSRKTGLKFQLANTEVELR